MALFALRSTAYGGLMEGHSEELVEQIAEKTSRRSAERWMELGSAAAIAARGVDPGRNTAELAEAARDEGDSPLGSAFWLWQADAYARAGRFRDAVETCDRLVDAAGAAPTLNDIDIREAALRRRASALTSAGETDAAIAAYREAAALGGARLDYRAGVVAENAGRFPEAVQAYAGVAAEADGPAADDPAQLSRRAIRRLEDPTGVFTPSVVGIVSLVESALENRDTRLLKRLASPSHFWAGPSGGHFQFEGSEVLDWLCSDLRRSRPRRMSGQLFGSGRKRYLFTSGWRGSRFRGVVGFGFVESGRGWQFSGVLIAAPNDGWRRHWASQETMSNQPLPFGLAAPWPSDQRFMAGGLRMFVIKSALVTGAATWLGPIGPFAAAALAWGLSFSLCGYGVRGFYYGEGPTHQGRDTFAIDFTVYQKGRPFLDAAGGTPVLGVREGIVRYVDDDVASGDSTDANEVQIDHIDPNTGSNRYVTRYLHLAGPFAVPVSAMMPAPLGTLLGWMNDTGNSAGNHLHFSVHDATTGAGIGNSVRPSPMEGVALDDPDSGSHVVSSNTPMP